MKKTHCDGWNDRAAKDTFWNLAVLIVGAMIAMASAIDLPQAPVNVEHVAYEQTTSTR